MKKACTSRAYAKTYRFSAAEYLPITDSTAYRASSTATEPDWDSIMIYDSKMGSALTKPNGDAITPVLSPSQRDVDGLKTLYGISSSVKFNPLGSKSHPKLETFKDIRKKDKDSGCKEAEDDDEDDAPTATASSSVPSATATANCKAIWKQMVSEIPANPVEKRHMHHDLHSRHLEKRGRKKGVACAGVGSWDISSFNYPSAGSEGFVNHLSFKLFKQRPNNVGRTQLRTDGPIPTHATTTNGEARITPQAITIQNMSWSGL
jgi:hypothetical protein